MLTWSVFSLVIRFVFVFEYSGVEDGWSCEICLFMQNNKGKGRLKYLLQQTEIFAHFAKGDQSSSQKKTKEKYDFSLLKSIDYVHTP